MDVMKKKRYDEKKKLNTDYQSVIGHQYTEMQTRFYENEVKESFI